MNTVSEKTIIDHAVFEVIHNTDRHDSHAAWLLVFHTDSGDFRLINHFYLDEAIRQFQTWGDTHPSTSVALAVISGKPGSRGVVLAQYRLTDQQERRLWNWGHEDGMSGREQKAWLMINYEQYRQGYAEGVRDQRKDADQAWDMGYEDGMNSKPEDNPYPENSDDYGAGYAEGVRDRATIK